MEEALINDRALIRAPAFRGSLFLLSIQDYPIYFRTFHTLLLQRGLQKLADLNVSRAHLCHFVTLLETAAPQLPMTVPQIIDIIYPARREKPDNETAQRIVQKLCDMGILVRTHAKGWKGNEFTYALLKIWSPETSLKPDNPETARTETIRKYLRAYGPATMEDISWWTGLPLIQCQRSVSHLRREALRFHVEGYRDDMIGLRETVDLLRRKATNEDEIQLLPQWDPYISGWRDRKRIVDKEVMPFIFDKAGNAVSVIVDVGKVIGVWQFRDNEINMLEYHIFNQYRDRKKIALQKIEEWARVLTTLSGAMTANIVERPLPAPLSERSANAFLWPLGKQLSQIELPEKEPNSPMDRRMSNTFRQSYLDNQYLVRPNATMPEASEGISDETKL